MEGLGRGGRGFEDAPTRVAQASEERHPAGRWGRGGLGEEKKGVSGVGGGTGMGKVKVQQENFRPTGDFSKALLPTSKGLVLKTPRAEFETHFDSNALPSCFLNLSFSLLESERKGNEEEWSSDAPVRPHLSPSQTASDAPASQGNNFNSIGPTWWRGK